MRITPLGQHFWLRTKHFQCDPKRLITLSLCGAPSREHVMHLDHPSVRLVCSVLHTKQRSRYWIIVVDLLRSRFKQTLRCFLSSAISSLLWDIVLDECSFTKQASFCLFHSVIVFVSMFYSKITKKNNILTNNIRHFELAWCNDSQKLTFCRSQTSSWSH